jgi:hypothetical protein
MCSVRCVTYVPDRTPELERSKELGPCDSSASAFESWSSQFDSWARNARFCHKLSSLLTWLPEARAQRWVRFKWSQLLWVLDREP